MANCQKLFDDYCTAISLTAGKKSKMTTSKDALRERIRKHFKENHPAYTPKFFIQGSYKMGSAIRTVDDICDLDDGIYFFREPDVSATTLQAWVWDAVQGYTSTDPEHRKKCIRKLFANDYEIDYPIYYKINGVEYQLAVKNTGWEDSDPKAVVNWFANQKDSKGMLVRIVKDLKAWCDYKRHKMPSGLAMTILAANAKAKIVLNDREDITLRDILKEIKRTLNNRFECVVPAVPNDDLFADYNEARKRNFLDNLDLFITDANAALKEPNELKASKLWRKHFGERFPLGDDKNEVAAATLSAVMSGASTSKPYGK